MITKVRVGNSIASCLIDSGATHNFMSSEWVEKARITTMENGKQIGVFPLPRGHYRAVTTARPLARQRLKRRAV